MLWRKSLKFWIPRPSNLIDGDYVDSGVYDKLDGVRV